MKLLHVPLVVGERQVGQVALVAQADDASAHGAEPHVAIPGSALPFVQGLADGLGPELAAGFFAPGALGLARGLRVGGEVVGAHSYLLGGVACLGVSTVGHPITGVSSLILYQLFVSSRHGL